MKKPPEQTDSDKDLEDCQEVLTEARHLAARRILWARGILFSHLRRKLKGNRVGGNSEERFCRTKVAENFFQRYKMALHIMPFGIRFRSMKKKTSSYRDVTPRVQETAIAPVPTWIGDGAFEEVEEIRHGLPVAKFFELQERLGVGTAQLADVVGIPVRTLQRRKDEGRLTKEESDRLDRVSQLVGQAVGVFDSEEAGRDWLTRPQIGLAGFVPLDLADTGAGIREVENLLGRIDYGVGA